MLNQVIEIIADELSVDAANIKEDTRLKEDLNVDSLDVVELVMRLEETFDVAVSDEAAAKLTTVKDIVSYIESQKS